MISLFVIAFILQSMFDCILLDGFGGYIPYVF